MSVEHVMPHKGKDLLVINTGCKYGVRICASKQGRYILWHLFFFCVRCMNQHITEKRENGCFHTSSWTDRQTLDKEDYTVVCIQHYIQTKDIRAFQNPRILATRLYSVVLYFKQYIFPRVSQCTCYGSYCNHLCTNL